MLFAKPAAKLPYLGGTVDAALIVKHWGHRTQPAMSLARPVPSEGNRGAALREVTPEMSRPGGKADADWAASRHRERLQSLLSCPACVDLVSTDWTRALHARS